MSRLDWRRCKKAGSDGSGYDPFKKRRPWQDPALDYRLMSIPELKRMIARLKREIRTAERA
jgi:hypothetical protein